MGIWHEQLTQTAVNLDTGLQQGGDRGCNIQFVQVFSHWVRMFISQPQSNCPADRFMQLSYCLTCLSWILFWQRYINTPDASSGLYKWEFYNRGLRGLQRSQQTPSWCVAQHVKEAYWLIQLHVGRKGSKWTTLIPENVLVFRRK